MADARSPDRKVTIRDVVRMKRDGEKIVVVTAYDVLFAKLVDSAGVDIVLVGDSLGNVVAGFDTTLSVTIDQMIYHGAAVRRGVKRALLVVDMPFLTYQVSEESAVLNCGRVLQQTEADAVKVEGGSEDMIRIVRRLTRTGIPIVAHLGFTPQSVRTLGMRVQGRAEGDAEQMVREAKELEQAGAFAIVLELIPSDLARRISEAVAIPTIGIGAGPHCDGQVLVLPDLLGLNDGFEPRFLKKYADLSGTVRDAVRRFGDEVRAGDYPDADHSN
ncbi:MAG TPA: 3-methyl-2-oxobutanoate hydroxymethyltransferase [Gemmatimonadaceae bacterium]|nr:3-methyl-2-oxobutanoate hydroxymethyltransferase [Gemmatimonadaceae bacterium]